MAESIITALSLTSATTASSLFGSIARFGKDYAAAEQRTARRTQEETENHEVY
jgi:hypothetical protein